MHRISGFLFAGALLFLSCGSEIKSPKELTAGELEKLLASKDNIFYLDVREPEEIQQLGSVRGYVNIPIGQLEARLKEIPKDKLIVTL
ncbi:MAG TPA: rhodanese-like domain-containing protein [Bryobacteraceae bacterium]|nr:rhodanese-like domain-containing protein [Bryobacteraceae bacterium]